MKIKNLFFIILILAIGALITFRIKTNSALEEKGKDKSGKKPATQVSVQIIHPETFQDKLSLTGSLTANEQADIRSEISGVVQQIYFQEGSYVSAGQSLLKINDSELQAQLVQARSKEILALENERRAKLLLQKEGISQEEYEVTRAEFITAQAQTQLISAQLSKTTIKAPFSGKIGLRNISVGSYLSPAVSIANLVNIGKLKITFSIPEKYAASIKNGTSLEFKTSASDKIFRAKIYAIEPEININTRSLTVRAIADNTGGELIPGIFANIVLPLQNIKNAIIIPSEAVVPIQGGKKVYIAKDGAAKEVKVETATRTDETILVTQGLNIGDTLIVTGVMALRDKSPIQIKNK